MNETVINENENVVEETTGEVTETVATNGDLDVTETVETTDVPEVTEESLEDMVFDNSGPDPFAEEGEGDTPPPAPDTTDTTEETPAATTPPAATQATPRLTFGERAADMGLTEMGVGGCYAYSDQYSEIVYRTLQTGLEGLMGDVNVPPIALFTKEAGLDGEYKYIGVISTQYKFEGNEVLIQRIRDSITSVGNAVLREKTLMSPNLTNIFHEIIIDNPANIPQVGDIYPQLIIRNSYDGTKAASIGFGLYFNDGDVDIHFGSKKRFGNIRQIHHDGAPTTLSTEIGDYIQVFDANIGDMIQANFENHITEDDMMKSLDLIEKMSGKTRRTAISTAIEESMGEGIESWAMTSWQLFSAITKFSTVEKTLNAKLILDDVAERVLVLPEQMINALAEING